jgi:hypothetical protein
MSPLPPAVNDNPHKVREPSAPPAPGVPSARLLAGICVLGALALLCFVGAVVAIMGFAP